MGIKKDLTLRISGWVHGDLELRFDSEADQKGRGGVSEYDAFVPAGFDPPTLLTVGELRLEPLGSEHNELDYAAWTSSIDHIRRSPGYGKGRNWPREMSLGENRADLERHARDFLNRAGFTFTVLNPR